MWICGAMKFRYVVNIAADKWTLPTCSAMAEPPCERSDARPAKCRGGTSQEKFFTFYNSDTCIARGIWPWRCGSWERHFGMVTEITIMFICSTLSPWAVGMYHIQTMCTNICIWLWLLWCIGLILTQIYARKQVWELLIAGWQSKFLFQTIFFF